MRETFVARGALLSSFADAPVRMADTRIRQEPA
jgi:hypothetical protein